jgi:hypothetical protein
MTDHARPDDIATWILAVLIVLLAVATVIQ